MFGWFAVLQYPLIALFKNFFSIFNFLSQRFYYCLCLTLSILWFFTWSQENKVSFILKLLYKQSLYASFLKHFSLKAQKNLWTFTLNIEVRIKGRGGRSCCVTHVADTFERKKHVHSCRWECIYTILTSTSKLYDVTIT